MKRTTLQDRTDRKSHFNNWGIYAAAAGASLSMATNADAGIISGNLNLFATLNSPAASINGSVAAAFAIGGANEKIEVRNIAAHSTFFPGGGVGLGGGGSCSTLGPGAHSCRTFVPRAGAALLVAGLFNGQQVKFFENTFNDLAKRYLRNSVIAGNAPYQLQSAYIDEDNGGAKLGFVPYSNTNDFIGFKTAGGDLGWLQVLVKDRNSDGYPDQVEAIAYGYNTVAGASILAGQTAAAPSTPEPSTAALTLLAAGAAGIVALRKARKQA